MVACFVLQVSKSRLHQAVVAAASAALVAWAIRAGAAAQAVPVLIWSVVLASSSAPAQLNPRVVMVVMVAMPRALVVVAVVVVRVAPVALLL